LTILNFKLLKKIKIKGEFCVLKSKVVTILDSEKQNIFCDSFDNIYNCFKDSLCRFYKSFGNFHFFFFYFFKLNIYIYIYLNSCKIKN